MKKITNLFSLFLLLILILPQQLIHADVAPPDSVPGSNLVPGTEFTQVRMVAETVTLTIMGDSKDKNSVTARTEAAFTMRNLGTVEESMAVRFPLSFFNGASDGFFNYPEIQSIDVKVNGEPISTRYEIQPFLSTESGYFSERDEIPWAVFDVTFSPKQDVLIEVLYDIEGYGYFYSPYKAFNYVLETGAGWKDSIGSVEIILRLPYEASGKNIWTEGVEGYGNVTSGAIFSGNEARWNFENLEPTFENNLRFVVVKPSVWENILNEAEYVKYNSNDGEAWGRLGKAYKEIIVMPKGFLRTDPAALEIFEFSRAAYENCLALLPDDSLWHYGYADLLWAKYDYVVAWMGKTDSENLLPTLLTELKIALELDPNNQQAKELLEEVSRSIPDTVAFNENGDFTFLGLTATPLPPTPWAAEATPTFSSAEPVPTSTFTMGVNPPNVPEPDATNPLCGSAFLLPALFGVLLINKKRK